MNNRALYASIIELMDRFGPMFFPTLISVILDYITDISEQTAIVAVHDLVSSGRIIVRRSGMYVSK